MSQPFDHVAISKLAHTLQSVLPKVTFGADEVRELLASFAASFASAGHPVERTPDKLSVTLDRSTRTYDCVWKVRAYYVEADEQILLEVDTGRDGYTAAVSVREFWLDPFANELYAGPRTAVARLVDELASLVEDALTGAVLRAAEALQELCPQVKVKPLTEKDKVPILVVRASYGVELTPVLKQLDFQGFRMKIRRQ